MASTLPSLEQLKLDDSTKSAPDNHSNGGASSPTSTQSPTQPSTPSEPANGQDADIVAVTSDSAADAGPLKAAPGQSQLPSKSASPGLQASRPAPTPGKASPTPGAAPGPGMTATGTGTTGVPTRPSPQSVMTSPPSLPRPGPSSAGAGAGPGARGPMMGGRAMGPMGMSMRGAGGQVLPSKLPPSLQAKMDAVAASRQGAPSTPGAPSLGPNPSATSMGALLRSQALGKAGGAGASSGAGSGSGSGSSAGPGFGAKSNIPGPASGPLSLAARRAGRPSLGSMGMPPSAPGGLQRPGAPSMGGLAGRRGPPGGLNLSSMTGGDKGGSKFSDFSNIMDPSGSLKFSSKATLTAKGIDFADGASFQINMDEMDVVGELGKGNYGSVQQVHHRPSNVMMAMKEIRLELDESKLNGIIMELDILHRAVAPEIVEFYGAFTAESCVYYCMELMDAGSLDTLTGGGVPASQDPSAGAGAGIPVAPAAPAAPTTQGENGETGAETKPDGEAPLTVPEDVLRRITASVVRGLKFLKDELQIMHRDVKPTNVLINKKGEVKLCDFGVSGQLEKSLAKTNIGCQSYMAPERIKGESQNQLATYTVSSDVWSVGLSIIELAKGCYPYPPETFANVFAQLQAIVYGPAPVLPKGYSEEANDFVAKCLLKDPNARPTYAQLLEHPFLKGEKELDVDMAGWVAESLERRSKRGVKALAMVEA